MGNYIAVRPHIYVSGAVILAANHNDNEEEIYGEHNDAFDELTGHGHTGATGDGPVLTASPTLVPIGSIIPFYDFNGALTFNGTYWAYCNGQTKTVLGVGSTALPDLSNRYLVGFGTEGGADMGSAAWDATAVGAASHQVSLAHTHTVASHTHDLANHTHDLSNHTHTGGAHTHDLSNHTHTGPSHTHTGASHTHDGGNLAFVTERFTQSPSYSVARWRSNGGNTSLTWSAPTAINTSNGTGRVGYLFSTTGGGTSLDTYTEPSTSVGATGSGGTGTTSADGTGATGAPSNNSTSSNGAVSTGAPSTNTSSAPSTNTSGGASPATDSQLSATQSIQPRSIRVRYLMRIL